MLTSKIEKIQSQHIERKAVIYIRQSTPQQVLEHAESTKLQYQLVEHAQELGWHSECAKQSLMLLLGCKSLLGKA